MIDEGYTDNSHPGPADLPLIQRRLEILERHAPYAMDEVNRKAFEEAYQDMLKLYLRVSGQSWGKKRVTPLEEQTTARFFANLQHVLVEGEFVSTYKYALLIALCRWALEHPLHEEAKPIDARELATHFTQLYWPQALPFRAPPDLAQVAEGELTYSSSEGSAGRILQQDRGGTGLPSAQADPGSSGNSRTQLPLPA
jgi:hypothetical protein